MAEDRSDALGRSPASEGESQRLNARFREALAEIEEQRDDAILYLSAIKLVLDIIARGHGAKQCGQEITEALMQHLVLEACAIAMPEGPEGELALGGFATQAHRLGGASGKLAETGWLALARLVRPSEPACFRRLPDGEFSAVAPKDLAGAGEGFFVLPFPLGGEAGGVLVLQSLVAPAQVFAARGRALAMVAEIVGQALTIARMRDSLEQLCHALEGELGVTRRALSAQQESLRSHEDNIQTLTQSLIRSNRVKREFLGTVSHELRTPLNAIMGYAALVRDGVAGALTGEQTMLLDRVLGNTRNLNTLIDDILFFIQLEADRVALRRERVTTVELIEDVVSAFPQPPGVSRVALRVDVAPTARTLCVDGALVRRILFHLVSNAFKFTERGEITIRVTPAGDEGAATLAVKDTGVGIASDRVQDIFDLFAQGDSSASRRYNGLGIGLTLVQRCVRLLGGEVAVETQPNVGSEFRITLPRALGDDAADDTSQTLH